MELRQAHQRSAWHVWIIVIPVCADMGRHVFMVFWSCRWFLPPAHLLFVMLEVRVPRYMACHLVPFWSTGSTKELSRLEDQMLRPCARVSLRHWKALNSAMCSIRSCNCIRYWGPLTRASCTCHCAWTSGYMWVACTFTIRKRSCTEQLVISPEMKSFGDCVVVACRFGILIADLSGPLVRL